MNGNRRLGGGRLKSKPTGRNTLYQCSTRSAFFAFALSVTGGLLKPSRFGVVNRETVPLSGDSDLSNVSTR
jgi:hypothetical protein